MVSRIAYTTANLKRKIVFSSLFRLGLDGIQHKVKCLLVDILS